MLVYSRRGSFHVDLLINVYISLLIFLDINIMLSAHQKSLAKTLLMSTHNMSLIVRKPVFGVSDQVGHK